jgi:hypothetical protein
MATSTNAEALALSDPRNPYPGRIGVIEPGAFADLLLVNGDPLADINVLADPTLNLAVTIQALNSPTGWTCWLELKNDDGMCSSRRARKC